MLLGLHHMHTCKILHRDFKSLNVFLNGPQMDVKLGDMGVAKVRRNRQGWKESGVARLE